MCSFGLKVQNGRTDVTELSNDRRAMQRQRTSGHKIQERTRGGVGLKGGQTE